MKKHRPFGPNPKKEALKKPFEDVGKEISLRLWASFKGIFSGDNLEGVHRVAWRRYLPLLLITLLAASPSWAEVKAASSSIDGQLSSKEGEMTLLAKKAQIEKKKKKNEPRKYVLPEAPKADPKIPMETKTLKGEVGLRIPSGMSFIYERDAKTSTASEMWLSFDAGIKLSGVKSVADFETGDTVQVTLSHPKDNSRRFVKKIELLHRKTKEEKEAEAKREAEEEALLAKQAALEANS